MSELALFLSVFTIGGVLGVAAIFGFILLLVYGVANLGKLWK